MVEVDFQIDYETRTMVARCSERSKTALTVHKSPGGFAFFEVHVEKGKVPKALSGKFTSFDKTKIAISKYFNEMAPTKAVHRDAYVKDFEERKKNNGTKSSAKSS